MAIPTAFRIGLIVSFTLVSAVSFVVYWQMTSIVERVLFKNGVLTKDSFAANLYATIPFNVQQNVYVFNVTNRDAFLAGAKPRFEQLGPYTFNLTLRKDMSWTANGSLSYVERRVFQFVPEVSNGSLSDSVYTVDPVYAVVQDVIDSLPLNAQLILRPFLRSRNVLFKHTVDEILYTGYSDPLANFAHLFKPDLPVIDGRIGYLRSLNDSSDGTMTVYSGEANTLSKRNEILQWNGKDFISYYGDRCNKLYGTNGELFPSFDFAHPPPQVDVFQPLLCRPWTLHYNGTVTLSKVSLAKFSSQGDIFSPTGDEEFDRCQQPHGWPQGLFDISNCQHGFPALVSLPHFLGAEQYIRDVEGLKPNRTLHDFEMNVFPLLGIPVEPALRIQINVRVRRQLASSSPAIVYPVLWQEIVLAKQDSQYLSLWIFYAVYVTDIVLSEIILIISFVALICAVVNYRYLKRYSKVVDEDDEQPILVSDDGGGNSEVSRSVSEDPRTFLT